MSIVRTIQPQLNRAMYFNGTNAYINAGHADSINIVNAITVEAWVMFLRDPKLDSYSGILGKTYFDWKGYTLQTGPYTGKLMFTLGIAIEWISVNSNTVFARGVFYHVVGTFDRKTLKLYTNGTLDCTPVSYSGTIAEDPTKDLAIGMVPDGRTKYVNALIPLVRIYKDKALSDSEVRHNMLNPNNPIRDGLVLWLDARACDTSKNVCWDLSGNGNHGTMYGVQIVSLPNQVVVGGRM